MAETPNQPAAPAPLPKTEQPQPEKSTQATTPATAPAAQPDLKKALKDQQIKKQKRSIFTGCAVVALISLVFIFFGVILFLSQPQAQDPILRLFGLRADALATLLVNLTNIGFGVLTFMAFLLSVIGFFKTVMTKKDDLRGRRSGMVMLISGISVFFIFIFLWISSYLYLSARQPAIPQKPLSDYIITDPAKLTALTAPITISFDASAVPIDTDKYEVISYYWNFGDADTALGESVKHTYKKKGPVDGRYKVELKLTAKNLTTNQEETEKIPLEVAIINEKTSADFTVSKDSGEAPFTVKFDASKSLDPDGEIVAYEWDMDGDAEFDDAKGVKAEYTFEKAGIYKVALRVTDNNNEYDIKEVPIEVTSPAKPVAIITHNNQKNKFYVGQSYNFSGTDSTSPFGSIVKYAWDFGDKATANTRTATHSFEKAGNYSVMLEVTDEQGNQGKSVLQIEVSPSTTVPTAVISTDPARPDGQDFLSGSVPFKVKFDAGKSTDKDNNIVDYKWDFNGDNQVDATGQNATYTFDATGEYTVTLTIADSDNNESSSIIKIQADKQGLKAVLTADPIEGEVPLTVTFDASGSSYPGGKIVSYEWNFGDDSGLKIGEAQISYKYLKVGTFTTQVTVIASDGKRATAKIDSNVRPVALKACFTANVKAGQAPLTVTFDPRCSQGTVTKYVWDFEGTTSREKKPTYTFKNPGVYTVTLEVTDNQNLVSKYTDTIVVKGEVTQ